MSSDTEDVPGLLGCSGPNPSAKIRVGKRIRKNAFDDMRRGLTPEQAKKWDGSHKDQLLGPSSPSMAFSTLSIETGSPEPK